MRTLLVFALCSVTILVLGCDKKEGDSMLDALSDQKFDMTIDQAFETLSKNYGIYEPNHIERGEIIIRRFEWLETSDTYFIKFSISPEEFKKLEQSADYTIYKAPLTKESLRRSQRHNPPEWFTAEIEKGFEAVFEFHKISEDKEIGDSLTVYITVDNSNENNFVVYIYCNYLLHW